MSGIRNNWELGVSATGTGGRPAGLRLFDNPNRLEVGKRGIGGCVWKQSPKRLNRA
jgi:hypothetical protein